MARALWDMCEVVLHSIIMGKGIFMEKTFCPGITTFGPGIDGVKVGVTGCPLSCICCIKGNGDNQEMRQGNNWWSHPRVLWWQRGWKHDNVLLKWCPCVGYLMDGDGIGVCNIWSFYAHLQWSTHGRKCWHHCWWGWEYMSFLLLIWYQGGCRCRVNIGQAST